MPYGIAHAPSYPAIGSDTGVVGATKVNTILAQLVSTLDAKVTPAGIDLNADLSFRSGANYFGAKDVQRVTFRQHAIGVIDPTNYPGTVFVGSADGELYFNDLDGNQTKITAAGSVTAATGNITGTGYGIGGKEVNWDDGNADYRMRSGPNTDDYADIVVNDVRMNDGSGHFARLGAPSLEADLTFTLPSAHPASKSILQISHTGVITAAPTDAITTGGITATGNGTFSGTLGVTGAASVGSLVTAGTINSGAISATTVTGSGLVTGLGVVAGASGITSANNIDLATGAHVTVLGTGRFKHGDMQLVIPSSAFQPTAYDTTMTVFSTTYNHWHGSPTNPGQSHFFCGIGAYLPVGARIRSITVTYFGGGTAGTREALLESVSTAADTKVVIGSKSSTTTTGIVNLALETSGASTTLNYTLLSTVDLTLRFTGLQVDDYLKSALVTYDMP